jgi:hypothetical protein
VVPQSFSGFLIEKNGNKKLLLTKRKRFIRNKKEDNKSQPEIKIIQINDFN